MNRLMKSELAQGQAIQKEQKSQGWIGSVWDDTKTLFGSSNSGKSLDDSYVNSETGKKINELQSQTSKLSDEDFAKKYKEISETDLKDDRARNTKSSEATSLEAKTTVTNPFFEKKNIPENGQSPIESHIGNQSTVASTSQASLVDTSSTPQVLRNTDTKQNEITQNVITALSDGKIEKNEAMNKDGKTKEGFGILDLNGDKKTDDNEWDFFSSGGKIHRKASDEISKEEFSNSVKTLDEFGSKDLAADSKVSNEDKNRMYKLTESGHYLEQNLDKISPEVKEEYMNKLDKVKVSGERVADNCSAWAENDKMNFNIIYDEKELNAGGILHELTHNIQNEKSQNKIDTVDMEAQAYYMMGEFQSKVKNADLFNKWESKSRKIEGQNYYWGNNEIRNKWMDKLNNEDAIRTKLNLDKNTPVGEAERAKYLKKLQEDVSEKIDVDTTINNLSNSNNPKEKELHDLLCDYKKHVDDGTFVTTGEHKKIEASIEKIKSEPNYSNDKNLQSIMSQIEGLPENIELDNIVDDESYVKPTQELKSSGNKNPSAEYYKHFQSNNIEGAMPKKIAEKAFSETENLVKYYATTYGLTEEQVKEKLKNGKFVDIGDIKFNDY